VYWSFTLASPDAILEQIGYPLDRSSPEGSLVESVVVDGDILYASGQVPFDGDQLVRVGKVPSRVTIEEAQSDAALFAANVLRAVRSHVGSLDEIARVIRITGYVNSDQNFTGQHLVINGASELVRDVFGDAGRHPRTALGMAQLPLGASVDL
jgi:enamine deaminase RidA (YjgF/YER057c/UK114 family)